MAVRFSFPKKLRSHKSKKRARQLPLLAERAFDTEKLERRLLLSGAVGAIPTLINPSQANQVLFGPGTTRLPIAANAGGPSQLLFKFSVDGTAASDSITFHVGPAQANPATDAAIALFDKDGNQIALADNDLVPANPGSEDLTAAVISRQSYVLGIFFGPAGPPVNYSFDVTTGQQIINTPITLNATNGTAQLLENNGEDTFNSPEDVDYYPLNLLNAGATGTVTITPTGLDTRAFATLLQNNAQGLWQAIDAKSNALGQPLTLNFVPPAGQSLTDGNYLLAVAPVGLINPSQSYQIGLATPVLGPASVNPANVTNDLLMPPPISLGKAGLNLIANLTPPNPPLARFVAPLTGTADITLQTSAFQPVISAYDGTGTALLAVADRTSPGTATLHLPVSEGTTYIVRAGDIGNDAPGACNFVIAMPYVTSTLAIQPAAPNASVSAFNNIPINSNQATYYEFQLTPGADVLAIELTTAVPTSAIVTLVSGTLSPVTRRLTNGQKLFLPVDVGGEAPPFDLYIEGTGAATTGTLKIGQIVLPNELPINALPALQEGFDGNASMNQPAGAFGGMHGVNFWQPNPDPNGSAGLIFSNGQSGASAVIVHYEQDDGGLRLLKYQLPDASNSAQVIGNLSSDRVHAAAAFTLNFDGAGTLSTGVDAADLIGVGVGMVPDVTVPPPNYSSILKIRNITLQQQYEQDLWHTFLKL